MKNLSKILVLGFILIYQGNVANADLLPDKGIRLSINDIEVALNSKVNRQENSAITIETTVKIIKAIDGKKLSEFSFGESLSCLQNKINLVERIGASSGFSLFRVWENRDKINPNLPNFNGWVLISEAGKLTEKDIIGFDFMRFNEDSLTASIKGISVLIKKLPTESK